MTLKFNRVVEVVKIHVHEKLQQAECSGSRVIINRFRTSLDFDYEYLWNQSTTGKRRYQVQFFPRSTKTIWWTLVHLQKNDLDLWPMTLKLNTVHAVVKVHVPAKYHRAKCSGSWVIVVTEKKTRTNTIPSVATALTVILIKQTAGYISSLQRWVYS